MIVRILATGEQRDVNAATAQLLIEAKKAVPVLRGDVRTAVAIETRIEHR